MQTNKNIKLDEIVDWWVSTAWGNESMSRPTRPSRSWQLHAHGGSQLSMNSTELLKSRHQINKRYNPLRLNRRSWSQRSRKVARIWKKVLQVTGKTATSLVTLNNSADNFHNNSTLYARAWDTISNLIPVWICRDRRTHSQSWVDQRLYNDRPVSTKYCSAYFLDQWKERKKIRNLVLKVSDINMFVMRSHLERQLFVLTDIFKSSQPFFLFSLEP
jgi:hypothetical protein